jgi:hypothetical protein
MHRLGDALKRLLKTPELSTYGCGCYPSNTMRLGACSFELRGHRIEQLLYRKWFLEPAVLPQLLCRVQIIPLPLLKDSGSL